MQLGKLSAPTQAPADLESPTPGLRHHPAHTANLWGRSRGQFGAQAQAPAIMAVKTDVGLAGPAPWTAQQDPAGREQRQGCPYRAPRALMAEPGQNGTEVKEPRLTGQQRPQVLLLFVAWEPTLKMDRRKKSCLYMFLAQVYPLKEFLVFIAVF